MGGKGSGGAPPGGDAITWGPLARQNGWGWDKEQPAPAAAAAAAEAEPMAMTAPEPEVAPTPAAAMAPQAQGPIGEPISPGQATDGKITTTPDTGSKLAQTVMAPAMWTDQLKTPGLNGSGSMQTTGQV
jgi:hypothetical protein